MKILIKKIQSSDTSCLLTKSKPYFIDDVRWQKMKSIKMEKDKLRSLASGYLLYKMCEDLEIKNPRYENSQKGKPYIAGYQNVAFNLSHSGDYAVLAYSKISVEAEGVSQSAACVLPHVVGIDIQQIRPLHKGMKKRILHEKERIPEGLSTEEEIVYLNRIWAIKESYVKMTGDGLRVDFRKIRIDFEKGSIENENRQQGYFVEWMGLPDYTMSICTMKAEQGGIEFVIQ